MDPPGLLLPPGTLGELLPPRTPHPSLEAWAAEVGRQGIELNKAWLRVKSLLGVGVELYVQTGECVEVGGERER
jgi:hypothetical protein